MAGRLLEGTDCGKGRLRSIVALRLEPRSRREMEDATTYAYTASLVSSERVHNVTRRIVLLGPLIKNLNLYRRCRSTVEVLTVHLGLEL